MRFGTVAIVGRTNVGKSTFLNAVLGQRLAITSALPQTTRDNLLGVVTRDDTQIAFVDTPGMHRPRSELGRRMNASALEAARTTDLVVLMTDVEAATKLSRKQAADLPAEKRIDSADLELLRQLPQPIDCVLAINKVDRLKNKNLLLPYIEAFTHFRDFAAIVPVSVMRDDGVDMLLSEIGPRLPEGPHGYDQDTLTDRPLSFFVREYVREQVLRQTEREVPHAVAVSVERYDERQDLVVIQATIHVEKAGQRGVLIGSGGTKLKGIGASARGRLEPLLGKQVHLELFVRVTERWKNMPRQLAELGYDAASLDDARGNE